MANKKDKFIILRIDEKTKDKAKQDAEKKDLTLSKYIISLIKSN